MEDPRTTERANENTPTVTVTLTNYNYAHFLRQAIDSVIAQSIEDFELLIIDNASTDDSLEILRAYEATDSRIRVIAHEHNVGLLASLREACEQARGRYRVHLDADDWMMSPDALALQVEQLDAHPELAFTFSALPMVGPSGEPIHTSHPFDGDRVLSSVDALEALLGFNVADSGLMHRMDAYRATEGYPNQYLHIADMVLAVRLCEVGGVGYIDRELYAFRQHGRNIHNETNNVLQDEVLPVVRDALKGPVGTRLSSSARRRVLQRALLHPPMQYIFSGYLREGWRLYLESARARPIETVLQRGTLLLIARTILGGRLYEQLRRQVRPAARRTSPLLGAAASAED